MRFGQFLAMLLVTVLVTLGITRIGTNTQPGAVKKETAYERVMRTQTLRCGYVVYPPMLKKDINTGELSGIGHDIVMQMAKLTKLKVEWTVETNWPSYTLDLANGKFDALCTLDFFPPVLVGRVETTQPLFLTTMGVYKKAGNDTFPVGFRDFNDPGITISAIDGSISMLLRDAEYPKAKLLSLSANSDYSIILENVANRKADIAIVERSVANDYMKNNPGKVEDMTGPRPLVAYPYILPVAKGEYQLARLFDQTVMLMHFNGGIEKIVNHYAPGDYIAVDPYKNYKMPN